MNERRPQPLHRLAGALLLALAASCAGEANEPRNGAMFDAPAAGSGTEAPRLEIPESAPVVVFLGDSIGAGLHLAEHEAFPAVLQAQLAAEGMPFQLINASESGRTTAGGVTALKWVLHRKPDVVVIELGGNDGLRGVALPDVEKNLRSMIADAREAGAKVLLLGVLLPRNYGEYGLEFDAIYTRLAQELDVAYVPYFMRDVGAVPEMNLPDGLHPTAKGHVKLADNVSDGLRDVLRLVAAD